MPAATSNVVSVSLLSVLTVERLQSGAGLVSASLSAFAPPSGTALEHLQSAGGLVSGSFTAVDPDFADVALLLNMDGTNGQTSFTDLSNNHFPMSQSGFTPLVFVDTSNPKFGSGAANVGPTSGGLNALVTPISPGGPLDLDSLTGDFTIEGWFFLPGSTGGSLLADSRFNAGPFKWTLLTDAATVNFQYVTSSTTIAVSGPANSLNAGAYNAFSVVCKSSVLTVYVNGIGGAPISIVGAPLATAGTLCIGTTPGGTGTIPSCLIDEVRISNFARYTSNYAPATAAFPTS